MQDKFIYIYYRVKYACTGWIRRSAAGPFLLRPRQDGIHDGHVRRHGLRRHFRRIRRLQIRPQRQGAGSTGRKLRGRATTETFQFAIMTYHLPKGCFPIYMSLLVEGRAIMCVKSCQPAFLIGIKGEAHRSSYRYGLLQCFV